MEVKDIKDISICTIDDWKSYGILGMGYEQPYDAAEAFMRAVVGWEDPELEIMLALRGLWRDASSLAPPDFKCDLEEEDQPFQSRVEIFEKMFSRCVKEGFFFDRFLEVCATTELLDGWFLSEDFMADVYAGRIRGWWYTPYTLMQEIFQYRCRFRRLIENLDKRLGWTEKYLEPLDVYGFWEKKTVYWQQKEQ